VGCAACSGGVLGLHFNSDVMGESGGCGGDGCNSCCHPGQHACDCDSNSCLGRLFGGVYNCICCPDPCYEAKWVSLTDAAFFSDGARPITQMRLRGDFGWNLQFPDRSEYFWARADGNGKGPRPPAGVLGPNKLDYQQGSLYTEGAIERIGAFVELPYLHVSPDNYPAASGFGDMIVGTKTLLLDCELLLVTFEFKTYIPTGNFTSGLGTGHVSLEPSLLTALKLTSSTYLQSQFSYWFPIGGDQQFQGSVFHYHFSLNQLLCNCGHDIQLIGTIELNGYEFTSGDFTDPVTGAAFHSPSVGNILSIGPGLRLNICDKVDFGVGTAFAITSDHLAEELIRADFRVRF
ncbi:MAG: transporter, partial [Candidatus Acidiferrum sp.]